MIFWRVAEGIVKVSMLPQRHRATRSSDGPYSRDWTLTVALGRHHLLGFAKDFTHATNLGSDALQLFLDLLVTAVDVVHAVQDSLTLRDQRSDHERRGCAQVRALDGRAT